MVKGNISKGKIGENLAKRYFMSCGFNVFSADSDLDGIDMVVDTRPTGTNKLLRIQVKSSVTLSKGFRLPRDYDRIRLADYFCLVAHETLHGDERIWIVPSKTIVEFAKRADKSTKSTIKDIIWKPSERELGRFLGAEKLREIGTEPKFHASRKGKEGEALAIAWLTLQGFDVFPVDADRNGVDLLIHGKHGVRFVQVKYSSTGTSFRNIKDIGGSLDHQESIYLLIRENPRAYFLVSSADANKYRSRSLGLYLNKKMQDEFRDNIKIAA